MIKVIPSSDIEFLRTIVHEADRHVAPQIKVGTGYRGREKYIALLTTRIINILEARLARQIEGEVNVRDVWLPNDLQMVEVRFNDVRVRHVRGRACAISGHRADHVIVDECVDYKVSPRLPACPADTNKLARIEALNKNFAASNILIPTLTPEDIAAWERALEVQRSDVRKRAKFAVLAANRGANGVHEIQVHDETILVPTYDGWTAEQCLSRYEWFQREWARKGGPMEFMRPLTALQKTVAQEQWSKTLRAQSEASRNADVERARANDLVCDDDRWEP